MPAIAPTLLWMDYETSGARPDAQGVERLATQRPTQFAWIRTTLDLEELDRGLLECRPGPDHVPHPEAVEVTGLAPQALAERGLSEWEFAQHIAGLFEVGNTTVVGFNAMRFDHVVTRYLMYRNLYPYYRWHWVAGNTLWDVLDVFRCARALRPGGVEWPLGDDDLPSMRQEDLARANDCLRGTAHDALGDVQTLVALARRLRDAQPKLWDHLYRLRQKRAVGDELARARKKEEPFVWISGFLGKARGYCSALWTVGERQGRTFAVDLGRDLEPWEHHTVEALREAAFTAGDHERPPVHAIQHNKCPVVLPLGILRPQDQERLGLHRGEVLARLAWLRERPGLAERLAEVHEGPLPGQGEPLDVDAQMYQGFLSPEMPALLEAARRQAAAGTLTVRRFPDARYEALCARFLGRNFPEQLTAEQSEAWRRHCAEVVRQDVPRCRDLLQQLVDEGRWSRGPELRDALLAHYAALERGDVA